MNPDAGSPAPWAEPGQALCAELRVDPVRGLTSGDADQRLSEFGPNTIGITRTISLWSLVAAQFRSLLVLLLVIAAAVSLAFNQWVEAMAVLAVLVINGVIGFVTEVRAVRSMEALRKLGTTTAIAVRDGVPGRIDAAHLVPGDILRLEGGDMVPADARILDASRLQANESTLTGESAPVGKGAAPVATAAPLAERKSMLYRGTAITRGTADAVVIGTGMNTELGGISRLVAEAEEETTPLEKRLNKLGQSLVWVTLCLVAAIGGVSLYQGTELWVAIETALALAVASVPEGLPIIATLALARGMRKMAVENALVNRLSAVETLGATSVICTDKTGTLTENRMTVSSFSVDDGTFDVEALGGKRPRALEQALRVGALCNDAVLSDVGLGDPIEVALLLCAKNAGVAGTDAPRVREVAFDSETKRMATVHQTEAGTFLYAIKGAPEVVLGCARHSSDGGALDAETRAQWNDHAQRAGGDGYRLLGLAYKECRTADEDAYSDLCWLGLVAVVDPPRKDVLPAIEACQRAGVRVVMVTGDQAGTASAIAARVGIRNPTPAIAGHEIEGWQDKDPATIEGLHSGSVFSRVSPKQKLDLVTLHQKRGAVVAMTGDGVNDAPALKKADIGVAMGKRGTAVAREAAEMVLLDDAFTTIVFAIREGRIIFRNIRAFVVYLLSCNLSEILVVGLAMLLGGHLPLLPLQILFLNLVTDVFPALALGANTGDPRLMDQPPRPSGEALVGREQWTTVITMAAGLTLAVLASFWAASALLGYDDQEATTVSFLAIAFAQLAHVFNMRAPHSGIFNNEVTKNRWVWGALVLCTVLIVVSVVVAPMASVLHLSSIDAAGWGLVALAALATLLWGQAVLVWQATRLRP